MHHFKRITAFLYSNAGLALLVGVFVGMLLTTAVFERLADTNSLVESEVVNTHEGSILAKSVPLSLRIPKLSIDVPFAEPLGLLENGEVAVPERTDAVGWYQYGPTPGELGPAVVLGHVDSYLGPAVFFYLGQLEPGDSIFIDREDGVTAEFMVTELARYEQSDFPAALVYGDIEYAGLRLITCSGTYDRGTERYTHNLVVYAKLVSTPRE